MTSGKYQACGYTWIVLVNLDTLYLKMPKTCCHPKALDFVFVVKTDEIPTDCWLGVSTTRVRAVDAGMSIPGDVGRPDSLAEGRAGTPLCRIFVYRLLSSNMAGKS